MHAAAGAARCHRYAHCREHARRHSTSGNGLASTVVHDDGGIVRVCVASRALRASRMNQSTKPACDLVHGELSQAACSFILVMGTLRKLNEKRSTAKG